MGLVPTDIRKNRLIRIVIGPLCHCLHITMEPIQSERILESEKQFGQISVNTP